MAISLPVTHGPLYLGFSMSLGGLISRAFGALIRLFTGGKVNHAFLLFLVNGEWMTLGANVDGVTYIPLAKFIETRKIVSVYRPVGGAGSLWVGLYKIRDRIGAKYDILGLVGMAEVEIAHRWFHDYKARNLLDVDHKEVFCSEFTVEVIRAAGYSLLESEPADTISPADEEAALDKHPSFVVVDADGYLKAA